jgi:PPOX class probable F420-dependent enzyme
MRLRMQDFGSYISLATFKRDGAEVLTPVWYAPIGERLYVFTDGTSYKVKRLRRDPRIRVAACGAGGRIIGEWHAGTGRIVEDAELERDAYRALNAKYGWQMRLIDLMSWIGGRIGRRNILELRLETGSSKG